jgi:POT family proton-dependent oligopeptide transporter
MLISVGTQMLFQKKHLKDPDGKALGEAPANAPKFFQKLPVMVGFLFLLSLVTIALVYIDIKVVSYLFYLLLACIILIAGVVFTDKTTTSIEKQKILVIFVVSFFVIFFWSAFEQAGASLTFFAEEQTNRDLGWFTIPSSFFQSLNSIFVVVFAPVFAWLWIKLGKHEPASPFKMAIGLMLLALGYLWIATGVSGVGTGIKVSVIWLIGMYMMHTFGELCLSPIGLSLVNKLAPLKFASLLMAVWFTANAFANKLAGVFSALYPENGKVTSFIGIEIASLYDFFMFFVAMAGIASTILFILSKKLKSLMEQ